MLVEILDKNYLLSKTIISSLRSDAYLMNRITLICREITKAGKPDLFGYFCEACSSLRQHNSKYNS